MNRSEIRNAIIAALREESTPIGVTTEELNAYIDDGYEEIAELTGAVVEDIVISCPKDEHFIELPANCLYPLAIIDTASGYPIDLKHWSYIDRIDREWIRKSRDRPWLAAAWGLTHLLIYPAFDAASMTITVTQAIIPVALASDASVPALPPDHHWSLVHYGHHRALLKDADQYQFGRSLRQYGYFEEALGDVDTWAQRRHEGIRTAIYGTKLRDGEAVKNVGE